MNEAFWQYAIAPVSVAVGGAITLWWQSRQTKADKAVELERQRDHDDLAELRQYRQRIDAELQNCRSSEQSLRNDMAEIRAESVGLKHQVETLRSDLSDALAAIKTATERIATVEADNASLEMQMRVISTDRDALKVKMDNLDNELRKRRAGQLKTRATDK